MKTTQEMIAVMQAFAEGRQIEYYHVSKKCWVETRDPAWQWACTDYRIKPAPEYVPFTFEDAEFLIGKVVRGKTQDYTAIILSCTQSGTNVDDWKSLLDDFTFLDGSPCGKLKQ